MTPDQIDEIGYQIGQLAAIARLAACEILDKPFACDALNGLASLADRMSLDVMGWAEELRMSA